MSSVAHTAFPHLADKQKTMHYRQTPDPQPVRHLDNWQYRCGVVDPATAFDTDRGWRDGGRTLIWDDDTTVIWFRTEFIVPEEAAGQALLLAVEVRSSVRVYIDGTEAGSPYLLAEAAVPGTRYRIVLRGDRGRRPGLIVRSEVHGYPPAYVRWLSAKQQLCTLASLNGEIVDSWHFADSPDDESRAAIDIDHDHWPERKLGAETRCAGVLWYRTRVTIPDSICGYPVRGKTIRITAAFNERGSIWVDGEQRAEYARNFGDAILTRDAEAGREHIVAIRVPSTWNAWLRDTRILVDEHAKAIAAQGELNAALEQWDRFLRVRPDERFIDAVLDAVEPAVRVTQDSTAVGPAIASVLDNLSELRRSLADDARFVALPYLQLPRTGGITVRAESLFERVAELTVMHPGGETTTMRDEHPTRFHRFVLTGLKPDTAYQYTIRGGNIKAGPFEFTTAPAGTVADDREVRIAAWGDSHYGPLILEGIVGRIDAFNPDLILTSGDMIGDGINEYEWIDHFFQPVRSISPRVPIHFPVGNHDHGSWRHYEREHDGNPYLDARFEPHCLTGNGVPAYVPGATPYAYSFTYAGVHVVFVDPLHLDRDTGCGLSKGTPQWEWLKSDLEAHRDARWTLLFVHEPVFCETWEGGYYDGEESLRRDLVPLMEEYGVDLCVSGHAHTYERGIPHPPYDPETGEGNTVAYLITGGGGAQMDNRKFREWPQIDIPPHRVEETDDILSNDGGQYYRYHFCTLTISDTKLECIAHWVRTDGTIVDELDRFVLRKRVPVRANPEHAA